MGDKKTRAKYTLEFKIEALRLMKGGQSVSDMVKMLGVPKGSLENWIRWEKAGVLAGTKDQVVSPEQMELARLRASSGVIARQYGARYFKKGDGVFRERVSVKYTWIDRNKTQ
jgi:transposase-like protein